jgi:lysyl-tRNA synthetase class 2
MDEVEALLSTLGAARAPFARLSYRDAFLQTMRLDPFAASLSSIRDALVAVGLAPDMDRGAVEFDDRDFWLDLAMGAHVGPRLGQDLPTFVYDYPASQAALARVRDEDPPVAERFELYWRGVELANGYHELADAEEQRRRFIEDQEWRRAHGRPVPPYDERLLAALEAGLPDCCGVALGMDRLIMLLLGLPGIAAAMAFDFSRA